MAVKFNKELLLKHRFWIMLGVASLLALIGIAYLEMFVDAEADKKKLQSVLNQYKTTNPKTNLTVIKVFKDVTDDAKNKEANIWSDAWLAQEPLFRWPDLIERKYNFAAGYFATEIKLSKLPDAKTPWPKDDDASPLKVIHGTLESQMEFGFYLKRADGRKVLICPMQTDSEFITLEDGKRVMFGRLGANSGGKLLTVTYQKGRYFNDPITSTEQKDFATSYKQQIHEILKSVDPLDEKLNGVVQLKDWLYTPYPDLPDKEKQVKFIKWVDEPWNINKPFSKEAWIAQEDLWIQKEIYRMIADANRAISDFKGKGGNKKDTTYHFANPNFNLELNLDAKGTLNLKIKNRLDRQQSMDLSFRVLLNDSPNFAPEIIRLSGDPLKPAGDKAGKDSYSQPFPIGKSPRNAIERVQQILTWQTAAVKRIDQIAIGDAADQSHSHRTFGDSELVPFDPLDKVGAKEIKGAPGVPGKPLGKPSIKPKGPVAAGANMGGLDYGLWTHRYVGDGVTEQFRRVPVAVVLIVDQDHVDRVLTSFNNSRLRFLPTQVLLNQFPGSLQPPAPPQKEGDNPGRPGLPGPPRPGGANPPGQPQTAGSDTETNMELVIYGIMTLYQRYPPAPPRPVVLKN